MSDIRLRTMGRDDWTEVAALIYDSTNAWYQAHGRPPIFSGPRDNAQLFCAVYEQLDPGCCVLAEDAATGRLAGSCFFHPRPTHVSLGIMNAHPEYFGRGVARRLLQYVVDLADQQQKPLRLVSSAVNLDSYSLYNRAGFVPRLVYQDMFLRVPDHGFTAHVPGRDQIRAATPADVPMMAALELEVSGIRRENDLRYFVDNPDHLWHVSVLDNDRGGLQGFLVSVAHAASNMLGPGVARTEDQAAALIAAELDHNRGRQPVWLVPAHCQQLVQTMYAWGAVNCELHFAQARGAWTAPKGIALPTFMPETG
jgi:GNAT superfamily N-acetyltransferase